MREIQAQPIRQKDGLLALVVFEEPASAAELKAVAATAPLPMRAFVKNGKRWLSLETDDLLTKHAQLAAALTAWIREVHQKRKVSLFFVGSDGKYGRWHADTVARFGERVRPVLDVLRGERSGQAHAEWIMLSFLQSGVAGTYEDVRVVAEDDPPGYAGDIGQCYTLTRPLVDALGPASLSALGPYGEIGFWARASGRELAPHPAAHALHLSKLADACAKKRKPAVKLLLVAAVASMLRDKDPTGQSALPAAITIAKKAADGAPLWIGFLETLVDAARRYGGASDAVTMAKEFTKDTFGALKSDDDAETMVRVDSFKKLLAQDLKKSPDASLTAVLEGAPVAEPVEQPIKGAKRPHLARLNADRLTVKYRGSLESQVVTISLRGSPRLEQSAHYANVIVDLIALVNAGLAGGTSFAPEEGEATLVSGSKRTDPGPDLTWKVRMKGVAPELWAVALHELASAEDMEDYSGKKNVANCPRHISIIGDLAPSSSASATTADVMRWLGDPAPIFTAWSELPFEVREKKAGGKCTAVFKPARMTKTVEKFVSDYYWVLHTLFDAHPKGGDANSMAHKEASKTQMKLTFGGLSCPAKLTRGPLLNFARRLHVRVAPLTSVELALG